MITVKHYSEQTWDELFQALYEGIYDGTSMLKSIQKEVLRLDEKYTGTKYNDSVLVTMKETVDENGKKTWVKATDAEYKSVVRTLPSFRDVFIHDMQRFLVHWNKVCSSVDVTSGSFNSLDKHVLDRMLTITNKEAEQYFKNLAEYVLHIEEDDSVHFSGWIDCVLKAIVETSRRIVGLDVQGRYKNAYVVYTMFGLANPGKEPNLRWRTYLVDEETAMRMYDGAQMFKPLTFKDLD